MVSCLPQRSGLRSLMHPLQCSFILYFDAFVAIDGAVKCILTSDQHGTVGAAHNGRAAAAGRRRRWGDGSSVGRFTSSSCPPHLHPPPHAIIELTPPKLSWLRQSAAQVAIYIEFAKQSMRRNPEAHMSML